MKSNITSQRLQTIPICLNSLCACTNLSPEEQHLQVKRLKQNKNIRGEEIIP